MEFTLALEFTFSSQPARKLVQQKTLQTVNSERQTGLEPATSTLARWRTTNCTTIAHQVYFMFSCSSERYLVYRNFLIMSISFSSFLNFSFYLKIQII